MTPTLIIALTIWLEAAGEPLAGKVAVAVTIQTRSESRGLAPWQVCLADRQFSCWNSRKPNDITTLPTDRAWRQCYKLARFMGRGGRFPAIGGRQFDHYHATWIPAPVWSNSMARPVRIGRHLFYDSRTRTQTGGR